MALTEENGGSNMVMPVAPMYGGGFGGNSGWAETTAGGLFFSSCSHLAAGVMALAVAMVGAVCLTL